MFQRFESGHSWLEKPLFLFLFFVRKALSFVGDDNAHASTVMDDGRTHAHEQSLGNAEKQNLL